MGLSIYAMIAPLAKFLDWSVIQLFGLKTYPVDGQNHLEEALHLLNAPNTFPTESQPAQVEFNGPLHFRFPTPRPCAFAENNVVHGRLYRCTKRWQERPSIILLHGGDDFPNHYLGFPWLARQWNRAGFNVATLELPYHFQRRPRRRGALNNLNYLRMAELMTQAVSEVRALTGWLLGEGCPSVALCGGSLGGWIAGMTVCCDARLSSVVMIIPGVCMKQMFAMNQYIFSRRLREMRLLRRAAYEALDTTPLNLLTSQPLIPRENILIVEGIYDLMCDKEFVEELWQGWGQPEICRLQNGHVGIGLAGGPSLARRVLRWLTQRLHTGNHEVNAKSPGWK